MNRALHLPARAALAALILATPFAAAAHRQWLMPSTTVVSGEDAWVSFDGAASNEVFFADHAPMRLQGIKAYAPDGGEVKIENAATLKYRSTFDLHLTQPGTYRVVSEGGGLTGSYKLNGEERRVGGRGGPPGGAGGPGMAGGPGGAPVGPGRPGAGGPPPESGGADFKLPAGATDVQLSERMSRNEVFVTLGAPSALKPTGKGLEFQPVTALGDFVSGEAATLRFLVDGKPAAALKVTVAQGGGRFRSENGERELTTDAKGEIRVDWPAPGLYWLNASVSDDKPSLASAQKRSLSYTTTLEVQAP